MRERWPSSSMNQEAVWVCLPSALACISRRIILRKRKVIVFFLKFIEDGTPETSILVLILWKNQNGTHSGVKNWKDEKTRNHCICEMIGGPIQCFRFLGPREDQRLPFQWFSGMCAESSAKKKVKGLSLVISFSDGSRVFPTLTCLLADEEARFGGGYLNARYRAPLSLVSHCLYIMKFSFSFIWTWYLVVCKRLERSQPLEKCFGTQQADSTRSDAYGVW